jgi:hypothetical protein
MGVNGESELHESECSKAEKSESVRRELREHSRCRTTLKRSSGESEERKQQTVFRPETRIETRTAAQAARVKPGASVRSAIVRMSSHTAWNIMLARTCFQRAAQHATRDDLVEHLKKRMSGRGEERDWAGTRLGARKFGMTRISDRGGGRRPGPIPSSQGTESKRLWWRGIEREERRPGPMTGDGRLNATFPSFLSHSTSPRLAVSARTRVRPPDFADVLFFIRSKRDTLPARCVAHVSCSLPLRRLRALMTV